jgi:formimidoylglutamate deiminase
MPSPIVETTLWAQTALLHDGWANNVRLTIAADGCIASVQAASDDPGERLGIQRVGVLLPAPSNLHSHAFQRAPAGMTEKRGPRTNGAQDSFGLGAN